MAENKMKRVADLLGIELNKEFKVKGHEPVYELRNEGLYFLSESGMWACAEAMLVCLLRGKKEILLPPWKPEYGEKYFIPSVKSTFFIDHVWRDTLEENKMYEDGVVFRSREEAEEMSKRLREFARKERGFDD